MAARKAKTEAFDAGLPVYVVFGKDEFLRSRRLGGLLRQLIGDADESMALSTLSGATSAVVDVLDECRTPSLLAPVRVVCVRDADQLFAKDNEDGESAAQASSMGAGKSKRAAYRQLTGRELMEKYLESPCASGVLVLECKSWPKTTRLYKQIEKVGRNIDCEPPSGRDFDAWVRQMAREEFGCKLSGDASERLIDLIGENPGLLFSELSKLATYVAPRDVLEAADVDALVSETRTEIVFKLMDAITRGDGGRAIRQWHQVLASGRSAEFMALGGLRFAFERLVSMKQMHSRGASPFDIKRELRIWDPDNLVPKQLARFSLVQTHDLLFKLARIDLNSKTGVSTVESSVERLIVELCPAS